MVRSVPRREVNTAWRNYRRNSHVARIDEKFVLLSFTDFLGIDKSDFDIWVLGSDPNFECGDYVGAKINILANYPKDQWKFLLKVAKIRHG